MAGGGGGDWDETAPIGWCVARKAGAGAASAPFTSVSKSFAQHQAGPGAGRGGAGPWDTQFRHTSGPEELATQSRVQT